MEGYIQNIKDILGEDNQLVMDISNVFAELQKEILTLDGEKAP